MEDPVNVVLQFEQAINSRFADTVCSLLSRDSVFVDSMGNRIEGIDKQRAAWEGYFKMVPDYTISHTELWATETGWPCSVQPREQCPKTESC